MGGGSSCMSLAPKFTGPELLQAAGAGKVALAEKLLTGGVHVNFQDSRGETALHRAISRDRPLMVAFLLEQGASLHVRTQERKMSPLDLAKEQRKDECYQLLAEALREEKAAKAKVQSQRDDCLTEFFIAARVGDVEVVSHILADGFINVNTRNNQGETALHIACEYGQSEFVEYLLRRYQASPHFTTKDQLLTPLHCACGAGEFGGHEGDTGHIECVRALLPHARIEMRDGKGWTAFLWAAYCGRTEIGKLLLDSGANLRECGLSPSLVEKANKVFRAEDYRDTGYVGPASLPKMLEQVVGVERLKEPLFQRYIKIQVLIAQRRGGERISYNDWRTLLFNQVLKSEFDDGFTALHIVAVRQHAAFMELLINAGSNLLATDERGETPVDVAHRIARVTGKRELYQILKKRAKLILGKEPVSKLRLQQQERARKRSEDAELLLQAAVNGDTDRINDLLADGAIDVNSRAVSGETALHAMAKRGKTQTLSILLEYGADVIATSPRTSVNTIAIDDTLDGMYGETPLHAATSAGHYDSAVLLVERGANLLARDNFRRTALHVACMNGHADLVSTFLDKLTLADVLCPNLDSEGFAPLHLAIRHSHSDCTRLLLQKGALVNMLTGDDQSPLVLASKIGDIETVGLLMMYGADYNLLDASGRTPVHIAAQYGHADVVAFFIQRGMAAEVFDHYIMFMTKEETPLHAAAFNGHSEVISVLITKGNIPVHVKDKFERTPLHVAAGRGHVEAIKELVKREANIEARDSFERTPFFLAASEGKIDALETLVALGGQKNVRDADRNNPLHDCARTNQADAAVALIRHGVYAEATNNELFTPLHLAAIHDTARVARVLLDHGVAVDALDRDRRSPLHHAADASFFDLVALLLDYGANPRRRDVQGVRPLDLGNDTVQGLMRHWGSLDRPSSPRKAPKVLRQRFGLQQTVKPLKRRDSQQVDAVSGQEKGVVAHRPGDAIIVTPPQDEDIGDENKPLVRKLSL